MTVNDSVRGMTDADTRRIVEQVAAAAGMSPDDVLSAMEWFALPELEEPEPVDPRTKALPRPSTTPPMWANTPQTRHRRRNHR